MTIDLHWLQTQFQDVQIINSLNPGGQKSVYAGKHRIEGDIALKIFHPHMEVERALREFEAVSQINSPRVPKIFAIGTKTSPVGDIIWFREQFIAGETLRQKLSQGVLNPKSVLRLGLHILEALAAAEKSRIVHRDVKPDNIIVDKNNDFWLLDFGLARHLDMVSLTATGALGGVGTPGYAPPEQMRNLKPDQDNRTDLFALGVTLYECIEGINPFRINARDPLEMLLRTETNPLPAVNTKIDADDELKLLIQAMSRIQRNNRLPNAAEALDWMQEICTKEGVC